LRFWLPLFRLGYQVQDGVQHFLVAMQDIVIREADNAVAEVL